MRVLVAVGVKDYFAWTDIATTCERRDLRLFSPLMRCLDIVLEGLGIEDNQGDIHTLSTRMLKLIEEEAQGTFARMFLFVLQQWEEQAKSWHPGLPGIPPATGANEYVRGVIFMGNPSPSFVHSLKEGTLHDVHVVEFGDSSSFIPDELYPESPELEKFIEIVDNHFGTSDPDEVAEEPEPEVAQELPAPTPEMEEEPHDEEDQEE